MNSKRVKFFCTVGVCLIFGSSVFAETIVKSPSKALPMQNSKSTTQNIKVAPTQFSNRFQKSKSVIQPIPQLKTSAPKPLQCTLTYRDTLQKAIDNSFDIKMATLDIDISKAELKATRADLFPTLYTQVNTEYNNGLGNTTNINYVGNTVVSSYTQYRNLASIGLQYNLFDFGALNKKVLVARKDVEQKKVMVDLQLKDLKLKVLDLYTKTLQYHDEIKTKSEVLKVYEEMFQAKERLFKAGTSDKISVMNEAVKIARTQDDIENSKLELKKTLNDLSSFTLQKYEVKNLEVLDFEELNIQPNIVPVSNFEPLKAKVAEEKVEMFKGDLSFNSEASLEAKYYDFELEKKKAELEMYKRQRYPAFKFYTNYLMYGQDPNQYWESFSSFKQASLAFGVSGSLLFLMALKIKLRKKKQLWKLRKSNLKKRKNLLKFKLLMKKVMHRMKVITRS